MALCKYLRMIQQMETYLDIYILSEYILLETD